LKLDSDSFLEEEVMDLTNKSAATVDAFKHTKICEEDRVFCNAIFKIIQLYTPKKCKDNGL